MRVIRQIETALGASGRDAAAGGRELERWGYAVVGYEIVR
jgi:hypothetical protein